MRATNGFHKAHDIENVMYRAKCDKRPNASIAQMNPGELWGVWVTEERNGFVLWYAFVNDKSDGCDFVPVSTDGNRQGWFDRCDGDDAYDRARELADRSAKARRLDK